MIDILRLTIVLAIGAVGIAPYFMAPARAKVWRSRQTNLVIVTAVAAVVMMLWLGITPSPFGLPLLILQIGFFGVLLKQVYDRKRQGGQSGTDQP